jgi:hypothetical protein
VTTGEAPTSRATLSNSNKIFHISIDQLNH